MCGRDQMVKIELFGLNGLWVKIKPKVRGKSEKTNGLIFVHEKLMIEISSLLINRYLD